MSSTGLHCGSCGAAAAGPAPWHCAACGSPLELALPPAEAGTFVDDRAGDRAVDDRAGDGVWRYRGWLPPADPVGLGEPRTPLVALAGPGGAPAGATAGPAGGVVLAKLEGALPTGSFKDRGTTATVSWLRSHGVREIVVDSSGNAAASYAAYAARGGLRARVFVPADASPAKLLQARAYGAELVTVPGPRSAAGEAARAAADAAGPDVAYASHLWHPAFLAGTATFAYEVFEQLGRRAPDAVVAPLGGGTLLLGVHLGFARLHAAGLIGAVPRLIGVQSAACAPLARAFRAGEADAVEVDPAATIAEGIRIARPPRSRQILAAIRATDGTIVEVTDDEIRASVRTLLAQGVFAEPTSAAAHAGLVRAGLRAVADSRRDRRSSPPTVVVALTGHGLKATGVIGEILGT